MYFFQESISLKTEDISVTSCGATDRKRFSFKLPLSTPIEGLSEPLALHGLTSDKKLNIENTKSVIESFFEDENLRIDDLDVWQANDCLIIVEYYTERMLGAKLQTRFFSKWRVFLFFKAILKTRSFFRI